MARITRREFIRRASVAAAAAAVGCGSSDEPAPETRDFEDPRDSFDHVVVLMLENRSFDNLLGYLYPNGVPAGAPAGKTFEGVAGKNLSNPIPATATGQSAPPPGVTSIAVSPAGDYHQPFPDPGEEYYHVNTQLYDHIDGKDRSPYNLPSPVPPVPGMQGFVNDYIENFPAGDTLNGQGPLFEQYAQIMQCFPTEMVPVLATLAEQFAVFDHWFCAVPSQTWCNRAFWNAGTSWGHVNNGGSVSLNSLSWLDDSGGETLFNKLTETEGSSLTWKIYSSNEASLTGIIHADALLDYHTDEYFPSLEQFFTDCAAGNLPSYSFIEPCFWTPHNDQHPSTWDSKHYGPAAVGTVLLGEELIWRVYDAVKSATGANGGNSWKNTLLIITHDEHGGCFDHVAPPTSGVTPPDLSEYTMWEDFDFERLGIRVPMVMVSAYIAPNTVINASHDHTSFLKTMFAKWGKQISGPLTARDGAAAEFNEVFTAATLRDVSEWPDIPRPVIPPELYEIDFDDVPLNDLQRSILGGAIQVAKRYSAGLELPDPSELQTQAEAIDLIRSLPNLAGMNPSASRSSS